VRLKYKENKSKQKIANSCSLPASIMIFTEAQLQPFPTSLAVCAVALYSSLESDVGLMHVNCCRNPSRDDRTQAFVFNDRMRLLQNTTTLGISVESFYLFSARNRPTQHFGISRPPVAIWPGVYVHGVLGKVVLLL